MNAFLTTLTKAINAYLNLDPDSHQRAAKLNGKAIAIELRPFHFTFQCVFQESSVTIHTDETIVCATTLRGTPLQLLGLMLTNENRNHFFADDVVIEGDAELGQTVIELFDHLQIDWEDYLSKLIGDVPAYQTGRFIKNIKSWLSNIDKNITNDINEYVHEEAAWLPTQEALQDFFTEIDTLRMDVDRMAARINQLASTINDEISQ